MTLDQQDLVAARQLLGVKADAGRDELVTAYRRLAQRHHPDRGGDPETMSSLNIAFNDLLGFITSDPSEHQATSELVLETDEEEPFTIGQSFLAFLVVPAILIAALMFVVASFV